MTDFRRDTLADRLSELMPRELRYDASRLPAVRKRASRQQRRQLGLAGLLAVAAVSVALAVDWPFDAQPNGAGVAAAGDTAGTPPPWSDQVVTEPEDAPLPGVAYLVSHGRTPAGTWRAVSAKTSSESHGCLFEAGGGVFGIPYGQCFDTWPRGEPVQWRVWKGNDASSEILISGAAGMDARSVRVTLEDGTVLVTDAVATPSSEELRFFALVTDNSAPVKTVEALAENGSPAAPPSGLPWNADCSAEQPGCPTRVDG